VEAPEPVKALAARVRRVDGVHDARLTGSRAAGDPTPLSDWDFELDADDVGQLWERLPAALEDLEPLALFWDPLGERPNLIVVLDGPVKVDLILDGHPFTPSPPWVAECETLPAIDAHFWDWTLWLGAKQLRGQDELVRSQLERQHQHLLGPLGVEEVPDSITDAVAVYLAARARHEERCDTQVDRRLGDQVQRALADHLQPFATTSDPSFWRQNEGSALAIRFDRE
jgi:predicted nucleotidyltransferase